MTLRPTRRAVGIALAATIVVAACGGSDDDTASTDAPSETQAPVETDAPPETEAPVETDAPPETEAPVETDAPPETEPEASGTRTVEHVFGTSEIPAEPQRIAAFGEEFLLADLLSLGVTPLVSTSNNADEFPGIDPALVEDVELIFTPDFNVEEVAALEPDVILAYPSAFDFLPGGYDVVNGIAPTVAIGTTEMDWRERLTATAEVLGLEADLDERFAAIDDAFEAARPDIDGRSFSTLAIFANLFIRAYTTGDHRLMGVITDLGGELIPSDLDGADGTGRVVISLEQFTLLEGENLLLLQTDEEASAVEEAEATPLWPAIPAVQADRVITLDRLGYPGAEGLARFATDLAAAVRELDS
ncbi:MAG: ABC transporter substrate-binding protein [Actinomycetota bacterium]